MGQAYNVEVNMFGGGTLRVSGAYDVRAYGAAADGVSDDTGAVESACAAAGAAGGGDIYFPAGLTCIVDDADITQDNITIVIPAGATVSSTSTTAPCFDVNGASGFVIKGEGTISGPGKATAASGCNGVSLTGSSGAVIRDVEITGFYHGIRSDDSAGSEDNQFLNLNIHDCAFVGLWPKEGDLVQGCLFKDIGTTSLHHGVYVNTAISRGLRLIGNHYEGITGAGVQLIAGASEIINNLTCSGETMDGCGWGYVMDANGASSEITNLNISGASINGCVVTDGNTGHGISMITTAGTITNFHIQAIINGTEDDALECDASSVSDGHFDIVVTGAGTTTGYGARITSSKCTGRIVVSDCADVGVYLNAASENHFDITAADNGNTGVYLTGASTENFLKVYSLDNTGNGLYFGSSAASNRAIGICQGNSSAQINNNGLGNILFDLTGSSSVKTATADDTTPSVDGATVLLLPDNTGATAITQLDTAVAGQEVRLIVTGSTNTPTMADGGNFNLSAAWAPGTGDTLTLVTSNGTAWYETARSNN